MKGGAEFLWTYLGLSTATIVGFGMVAIRWLQAHRYSDLLFLSGAGLSAASILLIGMKIGMRLKAGSKNEPVVPPVQEPIAAAATATTEDAPKNPEKPLIVVANDDQIMRFDPKISAIERAALRPVAAAEIPRRSRTPRFAGVLVILICTSVGTLFFLYQWHSLSHHLNMGSTAAVPTLRDNRNAKVWVDTASGIYHCADSRAYGTTKASSYMTQSEATGRGYRPAYPTGCPGQSEYRSAYVYLNNEIQRLTISTDFLVAMLTGGKAPIAQRVAPPDTFSDLYSEVNNGRLLCSQALPEFTRETSDNSAPFPEEIREKINHGDRLSEQEGRLLHAWLLNAKQTAKSCRDEIGRLLRQ